MAKSGLKTVFFHELGLDNFIEFSVVFIIDISRRVYKFAIYTNIEIIINIMAR